MPSGMYLHVGKKFGRAGSQSTTREEAGPTVPLWKNYRGGESRCATRGELKSRQVLLHHLGRTNVEAGPTVRLGRN